MSLINEALKKAQRQRTGDQPFSPGLSGEPVAHTTRRAKTSGLSSFAIKLGVGLLLTLGIGLGGFYAYKILFGPSTTQSAGAPASVAAANATLATAPEKQEIGASTVTPSPTQTKALTLTAGLEQAPIAPAPVQVPVILETPVAIKLAAPAKMSAKATTYIESLRISGIRASTADSKVLMNDRVYRAGDLVEHELGLRLVEIKSNSLTFEDEAGLRYTRSF